MSGEFLSRWSRLKEEARQAERRPRSDDAAPPAADAPAPEGVAGSDPQEPELTPEELADLPKVEEITAASDISGFLRRGVPEALRNAALRKMWSLNPAIRDFVGEARDYAYDWNTPGGVPGSGALAPSDDVPAMVRQVFGDEEVAASQSRVEGSRHREAMAASSEDASRVGALQQEVPPEETDGGGSHADSEIRPGTDGEGASSAVAAPQSKNPQRPVSSVAAPRHGSAKPA